MFDFVEHDLMLLEQSFHFLYLMHLLLKNKLNVNNKKKRRRYLFVPSSSKRIFGFRINARAIAKII